MTTRDTWVLLVGASGVVGRQTAARLRRRWPNLPILAGGRDLQRAEAVAVELGNSRGVAIAVRSLEAARRYYSGALGWEERQGGAFACGETVLFLREDASAVALPDAMRAPGYRY